jgi:parvulin-like peptidyl-prolyl isomerase
MRSFALVSSLLFALALPAHAGKRRTVVDRVAIVVNGEPIFESDLTRRTKFSGSRAAAETELIVEALFAGEAHRVGVTVEAAEVDLAIDEVKKQNGIDDAQLAAALAEQHMTLAEYRVEVERQLLLLRMRNVLRTDHDPDAWLAEQRDHAFIERRTK